MSRKPAIKRKRILWPYIVTGILLSVFLICAAIVWTHCIVKTVYVEGNVHYTDEEIAGMVMDGKLGNSTIYLFLKYRDKEIKDVPFVETMSVNIEAADTIRISVYEKALAGYVNYMDRYMYFDNDGVVVESSIIKTAGIPQVTGLYFDHVVLDERLPVERDDIFREILSLTQLVNKYSLSVDKIYFDADYLVSLYFGDVRVIIGTEDYIDEKVMVLPEILPQLEGKQGVLNLSEYTQGDMITFETKE